MSNKIMKNVQSYKVNSNSNISYCSSNNISSINGDSNVKVEEYSFDDSLKSLNNDSIDASSDEQKITPLDNIFVQEAVSNLENNSIDASSDEQNISINDNIFVNPSIAEFDKTNVSGSELDSLDENEVYVSKDDIDFNNIYTNQADAQNGVNNVEVNPDYFGDNDKKLVYDKDTGLISEVQEDGTKVPMGYTNVDSSNLNDSSTNSISSNSFKKENKDISINNNVSQINNLVHDSISAYDDSENMED